MQSSTMNAILVTQSRVGRNSDFQISKNKNHSEFRTEDVHHLKPIIFSSFFSFFRGRQNFIQVLLKDAVRHSLSAAGYLPVLDGHLPELFYGGRELPETFFIHYPLGNGFLTSYPCMYSGIILRAEQVAADQPATASCSKCSGCLMVG